MEPMHKNEKLIHEFYKAFQKLDWQSMQNCYADDVHFSDPVFTDLKGNEAMAMWHMLCAKAKDFELSFHNIKADDRRLRDILGKPAGERGQFFDALRKEYPVRREFHNTRIVTQNCESGLAQKLKGIGYSQ